MKKIIILAVIPLIVFFPSLFFGYTKLDDTVLIKENIENLSKIENIPSFFQKPYLDYYYRPIVTLSFSLNALIFGQDLFGYHLTNIFLHIINVLLIYKLLQKLNFSFSAAFFGALVFSLFPTVVPAVVWVPGRNDLLLMTFFLISFLCLSTRLFIFSPIFFLLALLTKETAIIFVLVFGLYYVLFEKRRQWMHLFVFAGYGLIVITYWLFVMRVLGNVRLPILSYVVQFFRNLTFYIPFIGELFFPYRLSFLKHIDDANIWVGGAAIIFFLVFVAIFRMKNMRVFILGFSIVILSFLPVLAYLTSQEGYDVYFVANRYYVPFLGIILILWSTRFWEKIPQKLKKIKVVSIIMMLILGIISTGVSFRYRDVLSFWNNEVKASPNSFRANYKYGLMLYEKKRYGEALSYFLRAEEISPEDAKLPSFIGSTYFHLGLNEKALYYLERALLFEPKDADLQFEVGLLYYKEGKITPAKFHFLQSLLFNPNKKLVNYNLGVLALKLGQKGEARTYFERELLVNPGHRESMEALYRIE